MGDLEILIENSAAKSKQLKKKYKKFDGVSWNFFFSQTIYYEMSAVIVPYFKETQLFEISKLGVEAIKRVTNVVFGLYYILHSTFFSDFLNEKALPFFS